MTNKEAIEQLKWVKKRICDITYSPESFEALNLAIKALTNERPQIISCFNCKYDYKSAAEDPCKYCKGKHSEWQAKVEEAENE